MKKTILITAALLMGSASFTYADAGNFKTMTFAEMDKNSDGQLAKEEVGRRLAANFEQLDTDNSGTLSADEWSALKKGWAGKGHKRATFAEMDKNSDGKLAKEEVRGRLAAHFEQLDTDGNGTLSADEWSALKKGRAGKGHKRATFAEMDKNSDGQLSKEEVRGRLAAHFEQLDTDNSGTLSADELSLLKQRGAGQHHKRHQRLSFAELDTDGNGSLSESEFAAQQRGRFGKEHKRPTFAEMDQNSDGKLGKEEVRGRLAADFELLDKDGNGTLSADELPRAQKQPLPQHAQ